MQDVALDLLGRHPIAPSLGLASIALLVLSLALFFWQKRFSLKSTVLADSATSLLKTSTTGAAAPSAEKSRVAFLYGTQTGTAERFAKQLKSDLQQQYADTHEFVVEDVEDYEHEELFPKEKLVFLFVATYGDGDPTDSAIKFNKWLTETAKAATEDDGPQLLTGVKFSVFGLGNKQYEHFAAMGKRVNDCMLQLGAQEVCPRGDGDDDEDIDEDFEKWKEQLLSKVEDQKLFGGEATHSSTETKAISLPAFEIQVLQPGASDTLNPHMMASGNGTTAQSPYLGRVTTARELHKPDSERSCYHVELDMTGSAASYEAGDHVGIYVENEPDIVGRVCRLLQHSPDTVLHFKHPPGNPDRLAPCPAGNVTLRTAVAQWTDVLSPMRKAAFVKFAECGKDVQGAEGERLRRLAGPDGKQEFAGYIQQPQRCLLEVMEAFPSVHPPLGIFFGCIAPRLQPRFYSLSSGPGPNPKSLHVTCAVVNDITPTGRTHKGVGSTWLAGMKPDDKMPSFVRRSTFRLPRQLDVPIVMIGPGTGLAPFRGFLQQRAWLQKKSGKELGPAHLFFGCRKRDHDFIYEEELESYASNGVISHLHLAFSRAGPEKDYVQHKLKEQADEIWALIKPEAKGHVYVCGDAKQMAKDVHRELVEMARLACGGSASDGEAAVQKLVDSGRYQRDVW
ncbi:hypothetical protein WJX74_005974 [Apatococcus lobatus]|uniref:NADPH--hemoprotein reductase n=2 Tax=Apatococcus TaxID=904362 RepID=A0AAW1T3R9_9CHLO